MLYFIELDVHPLIINLNISFNHIESIEQRYQYYNQNDYHNLRIIKSFQTIRQIRIQLYEHSEMITCVMKMRNDIVIKGKMIRN